MIMIAWQLLINGLIAGSIYALVAAGFSLIYSTNRFIHFAHGGVIAATSYFLFTLFVTWKLNFYLAAVLAIIFSGLLGYVIFKLIYSPLKKRGASSAILLIAGLALAILIENIILFHFGANVRALNFLEVAKGWEIGGAVVTSLQLSIIAASLILLALLWLFVRYAHLGKVMRAVADNPELAKISGINTNQVFAKSFIIGSVIAGFGSILIALEQNLEPFMGAPLMIKGFTGAIIGGITSLPGSVLGSYVLGLVENFGIWWLPSGWKDAIAFAVLFAFLLWRPTGILGINRGIRE